MKVSAAQPFQIVYSLYEHEFLGYLFESFIVHLNESGKLTYQHQNISSQNAEEFAAGLDDTDYELIAVMDEMNPNAIANYFNTRKWTQNEFFLKTYDKEKGNKPLQKEIEAYLERRRSKALSHFQGKHVFEMGNDGEPTTREVEVCNEKAKIDFKFYRDNKGTRYSPRISFEGKCLDLHQQNAWLLCKSPAWVLMNRRLFTFESEVDGQKIQPFLSKSEIFVPTNLEETYYKKFITPLIESFPVQAEGFEIKEEHFDTVPHISFSDVEMPRQSSSSSGVEEEKIMFELAFKYGGFSFKADHLSNVSVALDEKNGKYTFHKITRNLASEKGILKFLNDTGIKFANSRSVLAKSKAFSWLNRNRMYLLDHGFIVDQIKSNGKKYFLGKPTINIDIKEGIDWFDINAVIQFGEFKIPFKDLRKLMIRKKREITLPNGEIGVIPEKWFTQYSELLAFSNEHTKKQDTLTLQKHHLALVQDLETGNLAQVSISRKLAKLQNLKEIKNYPLPEEFTGKLRPYQKAGYNWLRFLQEYNFGGCLADDMGLGKTVQTLALLQHVKESEPGSASLLIMPTSIIYNWEMEARKFTPGLKILVYTGTHRNKDVSTFQDYDLVLTSYGITRLDADLFKEYYFKYIILDESQAIKNPDSIISRAVGKLKSSSKLILTGTPIENTTLDLWSQMNFINKGLLGSKSIFKNEFIKPIEKFHDEPKKLKLNAIIKPFILRRHKSQVAKDLPERIVNIKYCSMSKEQEEKYEEVKSYYRNHILDHIESHGVKKSSLLLIQGLTKLRQISNHPVMVEPEYEGTSGKLEDIGHTIENVLSEGHKILIFSQFVKHLTLIRNFLNEKEIRYSYLDGATKDRQREVERFQNNPQIRTFLISLKAGGLGLNLTKADYVFILDPWWNPAIEAQAIDRAHRIGQKNKVITYKFISKNSVEEKILELQESKMKLASDLITTEESFIKKLSGEDIKNLLN